MPDPAKPPVPTCPGCIERDSTIGCLSEMLCEALRPDPQPPMEDLSCPTTPAEVVALINTLAQLGKPAEAQKLALAMLKSIEDDSVTVHSVILALASILDHVVAHYGETSTREKVQ